MRTKKEWLRPVGRACMKAMICAGVIGVSGTLMAADHLDAPMTKAEPAADLTDLYAWTSEDGNKLNLVLGVFPNATRNSKFSDNVRYVFHVNSSPAPGEPATETRVVCTFNQQQQVSCSVGGTELVSSQDASASEGAMSESGNFKVFAGLRSDPFFFAFDAFNNTVDQVLQAAPNLQFNEAGCPALDENTQSALVSNLKGSNTFAGMNILALVVQVDKSLLGPGPTYGVWASTARITQ